MPADRPVRPTRPLRSAVRLAAAVLVLLVVGTSGTAPAKPGGGASGDPVITDCQSHGQLTRTYTDAQLRHALAVMQATVKQYTNCQTVIEDALNGTQPSGNGTGGGGGGSSFPTWLIVVIVVLVLAAAGIGGLAIRRRRAAAGAPHGLDDGPGHPTRVIEPGGGPPGHDVDGEAYDEPDEDYDEDEGDEDPPR